MTAGFDVELIRKDFPILDRTVRGGVPLVYLDSANTSQKPQAVLDVLAAFYERHNANIHRATHALGEEATEAYEGARLKVAAFINAPSAEEVIFTKNSSEALNLVANVLGWGARGLRPGDEVVITEMEHHSNIVPWQLLCERTGATLRWFGVTDEGRLDLEGTDGRDGIDRLINERTKVVALVHVSNVLGTVNPVAAIAARAHEVGALVVVDASQSVPQMPVDVQALGADFVAFTGHKMLGPTGVGVLWGRRELLEELPPFLGGGEMIETVTMASSTYAALPHKYEAGTPPIAEVVMLGAAVDYLTAVGMPAVAAHEQQVTAYALDRLRDVDRLRILGPDHAVDRGGAVSFTFGDIHPHDVAQVLDARGVAVRAGHHCGRPIHQRFGVPASTRASFYLYTTFAEIDALVEGLAHAQQFFGGDA
ncbi:MAG: cysteine desulfurase / selenocysteine lyase [Frankiales bacterium]|jgi:cysteine desulfurase/selenocysteine lyase|nr:cysteine desulfurase / selenocysteine lyase [Frankiales bacterium]MDX6213142.1 cysteine desulfurase / selenocysteine lyase [Frankiales bacterium]MDX6222176.1 cysteine desulfurase / selenocysteine lyase [Frankiales bacterium]